MKIKTAELTGRPLNWAVAKAEGRFRHESTKTQAYLVTLNSGVYAYSTSWAQGGPIIDREDIVFDTWSPGVHVANIAHRETPGITGPTKLIAAMRCYVASKLGDEVDVPDELCV